MELATPPRYWSLAIGAMIAAFVIYRCRHDVIPRKRRFSSAWVRIFCPVSARIDLFTKLLSFFLVPNLKPP